MGDLINAFREETLRLPALNNRQAVGMMIDEYVPHTYCWSPSLVSKPSDWADHLDVCGFFFLDLATNYQPPEDLLHFLHAGQPPIYIGFGSITGHDSTRLLKIVLDALKATGYRALLSGLANENDVLPENIFRIGNCPHDWLFEHGNRCFMSSIDESNLYLSVSIFCLSPWWCWYNSGWSSCW